MAVIKKNEIIAPFLGAKLKFIPGQDPMGMLNVGEQIFSMLLPGLNNVTERIRYYSFYCWFFGWYAKTIASENPKEQFKYLRRAEYLLALIAAKFSVSGIPGITEASKNYNNNDTVFILHKGTGEGKPTFDETYWKNPRGVFGQNYVSSLRQIGLIRDKGEDTGLYIRTAFDKDGVITGKDLEEAFKENISVKAQEVFSKCLLDDEVTQEELTLLSEDFNMKKVPIGTSENSFLKNMLVGLDNPISTKDSHFRKETTALYLDLLNETDTNVSVQDFVNYAYLQQGKINNESNNTFLAWYYYQLTQYWHIVSTSSLMHLLAALQHKSDGGWYVETELVKEITQEVVSGMLSQNLIKSDGSFNDLEILKEDNITITQSIKTNNYIEGFINAFLLLRKLMNENNLTINEQREFAKKQNIHSVSDFIAVYADLEKYSELAIAEFISFFIIKYVLNRHQLVALHKMNDTQSTEKFLREDGFIRFVDIIGVDFSSPRLGNLVQFFKDLGYINSDGKNLSDSGIQLHKQLQV